MFICLMLVQVILEYINVRWLSLLRSIDRLLQKYEPIKMYFLAQQTTAAVSNNENKNKTLLKSFFESNDGLCVLSFLSNILDEIQKAELQLQRSYTTAVDLHQIISGLVKKLHQRLSDKFYGNGTRVLLKQIKAIDENKSEELERSFGLFINSVIEYIQSYYDHQSTFFETISHFNLQSNEFLSWQNVIAVADLLPISDLDTDKLYSEYCDLKIAYEESKKMHIPLIDQITAYISKRNESTTMKYVYFDFASVFNRNALSFFSIIVNKQHTTD
jgi:hypothetical protein